MHEYTTRKTCRLCGHDKLEVVRDMGIHYVSNFVEQSDHSTFPKAPLVLVYCSNCTLVQLKDTAPQELLYRGFYWYRSGVTDTMVRALKDITSEIEQMLELRPDDIVLDIGSNDGTLLRQYTPDKFKKVGVEPAKNFQETGAQGVDIFISDFWSKEVYLEKVDSQAKVITAIGMFYDLEDPNQFIADIKDCLADDGVFISQLMCLHNMIEKNDIGNVNHEHLEYYTYKSLEYLFNTNGLEIVDIKTNDVNAQSYRVYARKQNGSFSPEPGANERIEQVKKQEKKYDSISGVKEFFDQVEIQKQKCVNFIRNAHKEGKSIWVYGASTKGNTILQYYGIDHNLIKGAAERSPEKWGKYTIGTKIKCFSEQEARAAQPDYFLVLPYTFIKEMYEREKQWRDNGGKFIVPLPNFEVLD